MFEAKVNSFIEIHKKASKEELEKMVFNDGWTSEARKAAKKILEMRI